MPTVRDGLVQMIDRALGDDPREALIAARQLETECDWVTKRAVAFARREGWNWALIGRLLGMTRQGVRKRFPMSAPFAPPSVIASDRTMRHGRDTLRLMRAMERSRRGTADADDPIAW
jgi:hypothetical protein